MNYFSEPQDMTSIELQTLVASRLEDMADQVEYLFSSGKIEDAELLREEGLSLAEAFDNGSTFLFINDLSEV